jgi:hypothetical protein
VLILDSQGEEIDRIVGFGSTSDFLKDVRRILRDEDTLRSLRAAHDQAPSDLEATARFALKLVVALVGLKWPVL